MSELDRVLDELILHYEGAKTEKKNAKEEVTKREKSLNKASEGSKSRAVKHAHKRKEEDQEGRKTRVRIKIADEDMNNWTEMIEKAQCE